MMRKKLLRSVAPVWLLLLVAAAAAQPRVIEAETARLRFLTLAPPQGGDAAEQAVLGLRGLPPSVIALRAFVVGAANAAPVRAAIEEHFRRRRQPLPVLTLVIVGALPGSASLVLLEAVAASKDRANPNGLAFISGQPASAEPSSPQVAPLVAKSLAALRLAHEGIGVAPEDILRATCFVSSLGDEPAARRLAKEAFPRAALSFVQLQRTAPRALVECETVARLRTRQRDPLRMLNPAGLPASPNYSHVALIGARRLLFSEAVSAAANEEAARAAFAQLHRALEAAGGSIRQTAMSHLYPTAQPGADLVRKIRFEFYDRDRPPASTLLLFEGLPNPGASFALAVIAVGSQ